MNLAIDSHIDLQKPSYYIKLNEKTKINEYFEKDTNIFHQMVELKPKPYNKLLQIFQKSQSFTKNKLLFLENKSGFTPLQLLINHVVTTFHQVKSQQISKQE